MYNKTQIEKNLTLFTQSLDEVFAKIAIYENNDLLRERAEVTLVLGDLVKSSLGRFDDGYIKNVISTIDTYSKKFAEIKDFSKESAGVK